MNGTQLVSLSASEHLVDGRYRIGKSLGHGSMGLVHAAEDLVLGRTVAIKMVDPTLIMADAFDCFEKEARALAQVRHRNVVLIYAFGARAPSYYIVMEYVNGRNLASLIDVETACGSTVPPHRAVEMIREIGLGLQAVHDRRLVHRDVKPGNIVIETSTGRPVLIDFGLARRLSGSSPRISRVAGTPGYMAPEAATDVAGTETTWRSDLYALACTAFELLSGRPVFDNNDGPAVLRAHIDKPPPALSSLIPDLAPLDAVLGRAMAKAPADRYSSCAEFVAALGDAATELQPASGFFRRTMPEADAVRVILLQRDDDVRRQVERCVERTLSAAGDDVDVECVESWPELFASFSRDPANIVVVDDENISGAGEAVLEALREAAGGVDVEILFLVRNAADTSRLAVSGALELPMPLNLNALATVIGRMGTLLARRRRGRAHLPFTEC